VTDSTNADLAKTADDEPVYEYLSTACAHGEHTYCQTVNVDAAPCTCTCHPAS
jgi:hypothetical protein